MYPKGSSFKLTASAALLLLALASAVLEVRADNLTVELARGNQSPELLASVKQLDARVGDVISLRSEYGEVYEFNVASARRSALGNKIIAGKNETGARLTLVVTSDGVVQGSLRDAGQTFRITNNGDAFAWHVADPYMAKPTDARAADKPLRRNIIEMNQRSLSLNAPQSVAMSDVADEAVN